MAKQLDKILEKELPDSLIKDWQYLMTGFKHIAEKVPTWTVKVNKEKHIIINDRFDIICHFVNREYIEAKLFIDNDEVVSVRHIKKYSITVSTILEFIQSILGER